MAKSKKTKYKAIDASKASPMGVAESFSDTAQLAALTSNVIIRTVDLQADLPTLHSEITEHLSETSAHNSLGQEKILSAQIKTLDLLFNNLIMRGIASKKLEQTTSFISLGFKAQNQMRKTVLALHSIQNPQPQMIIKQQNLAYNQQVNNGAIDKINSKNELLSEGVIHEKLDIGRAAASVSLDSNLAAVEKIYGATNR